MSGLFFWRELRFWVLFCVFSDRSSGSYVHSVLLLSRPTLLFIC